MPLGDSITDGHLVPGGYRTDLWYRLTKQRGYPIRFVGSLSNGPNILPQKQHEGHSGWTIDRIRGEVEGWLDRSQPDIILLTIGTNDVIQYRRVEIALDRLNSLIEEIFARLPQVRLFVTSLPPIATPHINARVMHYNQGVRELVTQKENSAHHLNFVEMNAIFNLDDLPDGIHPNRNGFYKMAIVWDKALETTLNDWN